VQIYLLIALGGATGALSRFGVGRIVSHYLAQAYWPLGTFAVNFIGSFVIGAVYVLITEKSALHADWRYVLMVGFFRRVYDLLDLLAGVGGAFGGGKSAYSTCLYA
jgi:CrcB protein